jgi:hypothetical protein
VSPEAQTPVPEIKIEGSSPPRAVTASNSNVPPSQRGPLLSPGKWKKQPPAPRLGKNDLRRLMPFEEFDRGTSAELDPSLTVEADRSVSTEADLPPPAQENLSSTGQESCGWPYSPDYVHKVRSSGS